MLDEVDADFATVCALAQAAGDRRRVREHGGVALLDDESFEEAEASRGGARVFLPARAVAEGRGERGGGPDAFEVKAVV